jgi:hypothetical protein
MHHCWLTEGVFAGGMAMYYCQDFISMWRSLQMSLAER